MDIQPERAHTAMQLTRNGGRLPACVHACSCPRRVGDRFVLCADGHGLQQSTTIAAPPAAAIERARANGAQFEQTVAATRRLLHAWLAHADARTTLLPNRLDADRSKWVYTPHNSGADLYCRYLVLDRAAHGTPTSTRVGRSRCCGTEIRSTSAQASVSGQPDNSRRRARPPSLFGAGESRKRPRTSVTEYLGRTPWFYRMVDLTVDAMAQAPVTTRFGKLPASDTQLDGDYLQTLTRLVTMTGDPRFSSGRAASAKRTLTRCCPATSACLHAVGLPPTLAIAVFASAIIGNETVVGLHCSSRSSSSSASESAPRTAPRSA